MDPNTRALMMGAAGSGGPATYVEDVFQTWLYTGDGSGQTITNGVDLAGKGGMVWFKARSVAENHRIVDTVRGSDKGLRPNSSNPEGTNATALTSFNSNGFSVGSNSETNYVGATLASWTFRKQAKFFDVVTWIGDGTDNRLISHNLGSRPGAIIAKKTSGTSHWPVWHRSLTGGGTYSTDRNAYLNLTFAAGNELCFSSNGNVDVTSTTFPVSAIAGSSGLNENGSTYVAYLFAHDAGGFGASGNDSVIKCGSYTGNASTSGPVVDLGWEPQWVLMKNANSPGSYWTMFDNMRGVVTNGTASDDARLMPHDSSVETLTNALSITSRGFQITNSSADYNENGSTHIYIAIRRGPMKTPTDATKVFDDIAYTGNGSTRTQSVGWPIDLSINMARPGIGDSPTWNDRLRGTGVDLYSNYASAESANGSAGVQFDNQTNLIVPSYRIINGTNYIDWVFRRAPGFFDVVAYTGTGAVTGFNHNLGIKPDLMIVKSRGTANSWYVYSSDLAATKRLTLPANTGASTSAIPWNNTEPTSTTFTLGANIQTNTSGDTGIAYLFASCPGVSKVGSYTGTGTTLDIGCGFTNSARFVLIKRTDSTGDWYVWDSARGIMAGGENDPYLLLNSTNAEVANTSYIEPRSFGFNISSTAPAAINANGGSFIYLAIA